MTESEFLAEAVREALSDSSAVLVFPSQVAADAWAVETLLKSRAGAIDPERFIGWDRFKEARLSHRVEAAPANRVTRTIWAASVVSRHEGAPTLRALLGPGRPSPSFVGFLAKIPPSLAGIARSIKPGKAESLGRDPILLDLLDLRSDYAAFLDAKGLFEPAWESLDFKGDERRYLILCPELIEDFEDYRPKLEDETTVTVVTIPLDTARPPLLRFENLHEELRFVFLEIGRLLDSGLGPEDIGITVSDLDRCRSWVDASARAAGVPIVIRRGRPLGSSPFGRLLHELGRAAETGFGLPEMEALLLDRFATWKEASTAAALVRFGFDTHAFASYSVGGRRIDIWEESFRVCGASRSLISFYRRLRAALLALSGAQRFSELKSAIMVFRNQFLVETGWKKVESRMVERAMEELDSLVRAEEAYADDGGIPSPYALYMSVLDAEGYVPQEAGGRVQVYPWRVSALLPFKAHFLVGCGQEEVRVLYGAETFLREDQKEALDRPSRDATEDFLRAYLLSGGTVTACHADEGIGGWTAPHPFFETEGSDSINRNNTYELDPLLGEKLAWADERPMPPRLLLAQKRAFERAFALDRARSRDFAPMSGRALERVVKRASRDDGLLKLSSTLIDEYRACPFRWLVFRALRVGEAEYELDFFDARLAGEMAHRAIEHLFGGMREFGAIDASRLAEYRALARDAPAAILPDFARDKGPFLVPMFEAWSPLLADRLDRLIAKVTTEAGWEVGDLELELEKALPDLSAVLEGRIDRLARRGGEWAIVDFKKGVLPKKEMILVGGGPAEDEDDDNHSQLAQDAIRGELANTQIASYVALAREAGFTISRAAYWSIEKSRELVVIGDGGLRSPEAYGQELAALDRAIETVTRGIRSGVFGYAEPNSLACVNCAAKGLCRSHFATG